MVDMNTCTSCSRTLPKSAEFFHYRVAKTGELNGSCKDCENARKRAYREKNLELVRQQELQRYSRGDDAQRNRAWYEKNPEKAKARSRRYRAQKRSSASEVYSLEDVLTLYGSVCHICAEEIDMLAPRRVGTPGWKRGLHIDHLQPISKGGPDTLGNVRPSHGECNISRGSNA